MPAKSPTIADPTAAFILGVSLVLSFRYLLILKVVIVAITEVAANPRPNSAEIYPVLWRFFSGAKI